MSHILEKRSCAPAQRNRSSLGGAGEFAIGAAAWPDGRVAILLSRYPDISRAEFADVLDFVKGARPSQLRRLRSTEAVRSKLERFMMEQQRFIPSRRERRLWIVATFLMALLFCWLLWDLSLQPLGPAPEPAVEISSPAVAPHRESGGDA